MPVAQPRIPAHTHRDLLMLAAQFQYEFKRQVSMGEIIGAALTVAQRYPDELKALLAASETS
jgi:hypothetical protein